MLRRIIWPEWIPHLEVQHVWTGGSAFNDDGVRITDGSSPPGQSPPLLGGSCGCLGAWAEAVFGSDQGNWFDDGSQWHETARTLQHPFAHTLIVELNKRGLWRGTIAESNDCAKGREQNLCDAWNAAAEKYGFTEVSNA